MGFKPLLLLFIASLVACSHSGPRYPVEADFGNHALKTTVDSEIAKYYAEEYLQERRANAEWNILLDSLHATSGVPDGAKLNDLSNRFGVDFTALFLAKQLISDPENKRIAERFTRNFEREKQAQSGVLPGDYLVAFAPGWFYRRNPQTGADFAAPRRILERRGVKTRLIETEEAGTVERNAEIISAALTRMSSEHKKIILVSTSKAGPEAALALSMLIESPHKVKAWVNIGGLLRGTKLADEALQWPQRLYVRFFILGGYSFDGINSLTRERSKERLKKQAPLDDILVVNYAAIPMSGQVSEDAGYGYGVLSEEGPNDGLTLITDELVLGGLTLIELGLDHYYRHPQIHHKTAALAQTVIEYLMERESKKD
ncbi:MAG: hypothetical protein ACREV9_17915 [Burkholderiales bacterium]